MGNSLNGASLFSDVNHPYRIELGRHASIDVSKTKEEGSYINDKLCNMTKMLYTVGQSSICELKFERSFGMNCKKALLSLHDEDNRSGFDIKITIRKTETGHIEIAANPDEFCRIRDTTINIWPNECNRSINACGGVTELTTVVYGKGRRGGLIVIESKKKSINDPNPYIVTVAHYLAVDDGNFISPTKDIGLSVVVKIQVSNDRGLKFTIEGPERHPSAALFYMFDQVIKTDGAWKPRLCPQCANIQKQHNRLFLQTSESEDSDYFPPRQGNRSTSNSESVIANDSRVKGNYNGSLFVRKLNLFRR